MNRLNDIQDEMLDVLERIERLNVIEQLHQRQPLPDALALESYRRLRQQYIQQLEELLTSLNIGADIHLKAA